MHMNTFQRAEEALTSQAKDMDTITHADGTSLKNMYAGAAAAVHVGYDV